MSAPPSESKLSRASYKGPTGFNILIVKPLGISSLI